MISIIASPKFARFGPITFLSAKMSSTNIYSTSRTTSPTLWTTIGRAIIVRFHATLISLVFSVSKQFFHISSVSAAIISRTISVCSAQRFGVVSCIHARRREWTAISWDSRSRINLWKCEKVAVEIPSIARALELIACFAGANIGAVNGGAVVLVARIFSVVADTAGVLIAGLRRTSFVAGNSGAGTIRARRTGHRSESACFVPIGLAGCLSRISVLVAISPATVGTALFSGTRRSASPVVSRWVANFVGIAVIRFCAVDNSCFYCCSTDGSSGFIQIQMVCAYWLINLYQYIIKMCSWAKAPIG